MQCDPFLNVTLPKAALHESVPVVTVAPPSESFCNELLCYGDRWRKSCVVLDWFLVLTFKLPDTNAMKDRNLSEAFGIVCCVFSPFGEF
jgi:hypothetical protein